MGDISGARSRKSSHGRWIYFLEAKGFTHSSIEFNGNETSERALESTRNGDISSGETASVREIKETEERGTEFALKGTVDTSINRGTIKIRGANGQRITLERRLQNPRVELRRER